MTVYDFKKWLEGFSEAMEGKPLSKEHWEIIQKKLDTVIMMNDGKWKATDATSTDGTSIVYLTEKRDTAVEYDSYGNKVT